MQSLNSTNSASPVKSPPLPLSDIDKLDQLLFFMKTNKNEHVNIYAFCKTKWEDNKLLYLFYAEYLKKHSLTVVLDQQQASEYSWNQKISPEGLAFNGFKNEYRRQHEQKRMRKRSVFIHGIKILKGFVLPALAYLNLLLGLRFRF
jgi:hypothetical protein